MQVVYLDQNKWIELARSAYGKNESAKLAACLDFLHKARELKQACFPLALGHYLETHGSHPGPHRERLAVFMRHLSGGRTFCPIEEIVSHEMDAALWEIFPESVDPRSIKPLTLLGNGLSHASGRPSFALKLKPELDEYLPAESKAALTEFFEISMLSGMGPTGPAPRWDATRMENSFMGHLRALQENASPHLDNLGDNLLYALALVDYLEPLNQALARHRISASWLEAEGEEGLKKFVDLIPSLRIQMHLKRHWMRNRTLQSKRTDLNDWGQTAPMAMYCDVMVIEKQLANLLNRSGINLKAKVITKLSDLPEVLIAQSAARG